MQRESGKDPEKDDGTMTWLIVVFLLTIAIGLGAMSIAGLVKANSYENELSNAIEAFQNTVR